MLVGLLQREGLETKTRVFLSAFSSLCFCLFALLIVCWSTGQTVEANSAASAADARPAAGRDPRGHQGHSRVNHGGIGCCVLVLLVNVGTKLIHAQMCLCLRCVIQRGQGHSHTNDRGIVVVCSSRLCCYVDGLNTKQEAALTCLGNLASWPPNTVYMMQSHGELLTYLLGMLNEPTTNFSAEAELIAFGAAYLSGNLSYISPSLVGQPLFMLDHYRGPIIALTRQALAHQNQTGAFWSLWSSCHAHDATFEVSPTEMHRFAAFAQSLSSNLSEFTRRYGPPNTIPCLWSNLRGVFRLISSPTIAIRAFGWWLMGNINYQVLLCLCCCVVCVASAPLHTPPSLLTLLPLPSPYWCSRPATAAR